MQLESEWLQPMPEPLLYFPVVSGTCLLSRREGLNSSQYFMTRT